MLNRKVNGAMTLVILLIVLITTSCGGQPQQRSSEKDKSRSGPLFAFEGERLQPVDCVEVVDDAPTGELVSRYIASIHGGQLAVKEHCVTDAHPLVDDLAKGECTGGCGVYDTYRRGPLDFALYFAVMNLALRTAKIKVERLDLSVEDHGGARLTPLGGDPVFATTSYQEVGRQKARFSLGEGSSCIVRLKTYQDVHALDRTDQYGAMPVIDVSSQMSSGEIWVEHRQVGSGYEIMLIERRLAEDRGHGEVHERELLCINPKKPIDPIAGPYQFLQRELGRATLRISVTKVGSQ